MPSAIIRFTDPSHWRQSFEANVEAASAPLGRYYPINPFNVPVLFESSILAFGASTNDLQVPRRLAYWARQQVASQGSISGLIQTDQKRCYLETIHAYRFELLSPTYQVKIVVPWWIKQVNISIWEYTGPIDDELDVIRADIARLEQKIDAL